MFEILSPNLLPSLVMLLFLLFLLFPILSPAQRCHPTDRNALLNFKNNFSNPNELPSWTPDFDCCYILECNETTNRVTDVTITYSDLSGTIPNAIADLPYLTTLRLHKMPFLIGQIPPSIGKMKLLISLTISWTNISGPVPHFLSNLKNLMFLNLSFNNLSGSIPPSLSSYPNIIGIDLSRNHLTGTIPETFGYFPKTVTHVALILSHNNLSGEIPKILANTNFSAIVLSRNTFSGDASMFFGKSKISNTVDISRNNFEFDFSKVSFMSESLVTLDISHNRIYGSIPSQITEAIYLQSLNVSYNRLCGEIPSGWKLRYRSEGFDNTSFFHNRCLCGSPLDKCKP